MPNAENFIRVSDIVHQRLDRLKETEGIETYNSSIRLLLDKYDNNRFLERVDQARSNTTQVVENTTLPTANVFCGVCGEQVAKLVFEEDANTELARPPLLYNGVFRCPDDDCHPDNHDGDYRYGHHLIAMPPDAGIPTDTERENTLTAHWNSLLPFSDFSDDEREFRILSWVGTAEHEGWIWRPPLPTWRVFADLDIIVDSLGTALEDHYDLSVSTISPSADCCSAASWHFHVETDSSSQASEPGSQSVSMAATDAIGWLESWLSETDASVEYTDSGEHQSIVFSDLTQVERAGESGGDDENEPETETGADSSGPQEADD